MGVFHRKSPTVQFLVALTLSVFVYILGSSLWATKAANMAVNSDGGGSMSSVEKEESLSSTTTTTTVEIHTGKTPRGGLDYYYCNARIDGIIATQQIVLLHGSAFTKEDWKESGILQDLCQRHVAVAALDLSVRASPSDLMQTLQELQETKVVADPIDTLVTPSASGRAITEALLLKPDESYNVAALRQRVRSWVPVACNSVTALRDPMRLSQLQNWPILAIHGSQDELGKRSTGLLKQYAQAQVQEIPGRHPCYLDSPLLFVEKVMAFLEQLPPQ